MTVDGVINILALIITVVGPLAPIAGSMLLIWWAARCFRGRKSRNDGIIVYREPDEYTMRDVSPRHRRVH